MIIVDSDSLFSLLIERVQWKYESKCIDIA